MCLTYLYESNLMRCSTKLLFCLYRTLCLNPTIRNIDLAFHIKCLKLLQLMEENNDTAVLEYYSKDMYLYHSEDKKRAILEKVR